MKGVGWGMGQGEEGEESKVRMPEVTGALLNDATEGCEHRVLSKSVSLFVCLLPIPVC